jgi:CheY-like chemotaxis protein/c-di-GMP-binding flagellar brake protein YcgR
MKTVILIENDTAQLEALVSILRKWPKEISILTASEEEAAIAIISSQHVDLIICSLRMAGRDELEGLSRLTARYPFIPCLAIAAGGKDICSSVAETGASRCLEQPLDNDRLLKTVAELLELSSSGTVKGIPIYSFLQMLESERKTCTLLVHSRQDKGVLYVRDGELIGAETAKLRHIDAAHAILTWEEAVIEIKYLNDRQPREIDRPLITLIMEAFQSKDEGTLPGGPADSAIPAGEDGRRTDEQQPGPDQPQLSHVSIVGTRIALDIGSRVKLEINGISADMVSIVVGMLQDRLFIVTTPTPHEAVHEAIETSRRIVVRYIHAGKVCMFKSQVLRSVEEPCHLLFLDYPQVIHYHELRKTKRLTIFIPCTIGLIDGTILYGVLVDLSNGGTLCAIKLKDGASSPRIDLGDEVQLRCLLPGLKEEQEMTGLIRNIKKSKQELRIGIEFRRLQSHLRETIARYLSSIEQLAS